MSHASDGDLFGKEESKTRAKKRKRISKDTTTNYYHIKTFKSSFRRMVRGKRYAQEIRRIVVYMNQLRAKASWVIKHQVFSLFEADQNIPPEFWNQNSFNQILLLIHDGKIRKPNPSLSASVEAVKHWMEPLSTTHIPAFSQLAGFIARTMMCGLKNHLRFHLKTMFNAWIRNHVRAFMDPSDRYQKKRYAEYLARIQELPFARRYNEWKDTLTPMFAQLDRLNESKPDEDEEKVPPLDYSQLLKWMWQLRRECEELDETTQMNSKQIAIIPQNSWKVGFVRFDSYIMATIYKELRGQKERRSVKDLAHTHAEEVWSSMLNMDRIRNMRNPPQHQFNWSISTDGISIAIPFIQTIPKSKSAKRSKISKLSSRLYSSKEVVSKLDTRGSQNRWVGVDPGVNSIVTACDVKTNEKPFHLSQAQYRRESGLKDQKLQKFYQKRCQDLQDLLSTIPHQKTSMTSRLELYVRTITPQWGRICAYESSMKLRRLKWLVDMKNHSFIDTFVSASVNSCGEDAVLLWGNGGGEGHFGKLKTRGPKGPIKKLRRLFSKHLPVVVVDEFRTSKCCWECGQELLHPVRHGRRKKWHKEGSEIYEVAYCRETAHRHMVNRDHDAARKIGLRFLAELFGYDLGVWKRDSVLRVGVHCDSLLRVSESL